jgi:hypothetical protein
MGCAFKIKIIIIQNTKNASQIAAQFELIQGIVSQTVVNIGHLPPKVKDSMDEARANAAGE